MHERYCQAYVLYGTVTTVCPQLLFALKYCSPSTTVLLNYAYAMTMTITMTMNMAMNELNLNLNLNCV